MNREQRRLLQKQNGSFVLINKRTHEAKIISRKEAEEFAKTHNVIEPEPLLSSHEVIQLLREIMRNFPVALEVLQAQDSRYRDFTLADLHGMGHLLAIALCMHFQQPLDGFPHHFICRMLQEEGLR